MKSQAMAILDQVGMADKAMSKPSELSGGQQQRVAIARALVTNPPLVLADEPTGNLDTRNADDIFALLRALNQKMGMALMVVTHDPRLAQRCDRIIEIVDGLIKSDTDLRDARAAIE
jgi:lipoprotein-releasing system ATP-binding protein